MPSTEISQGIVCLIIIDMVEIYILARILNFNSRNNYFIHFFNFSALSVNFVLMVNLHPFSFSFF
jgi:hypothetical protein